MNQEVANNMKLDFKPLSVRKTNANFEDESQGVKEGPKSVQKPHMTLKMHAPAQKKRVLIVAKSSSHCKGKFW